MSEYDIVLITSRMLYIDNYITKMLTNTVVNHKYYYLLVSL